MRNNESHWNGLKHVDGNHWIAVSSVGCNNEEITLRTCPYCSVSCFVVIIELQYGGGGGRLRE